jgi:hypothetical protein
MWFAWMLKWLGRKKCVAFMGNLEKMWPIRAVGGGSGQTYCNVHCVVLV